ncbi:MAG: hypothetical protein RLZZ60_559 [Bacteroidota bacterium]|jgi:hypothetical protein
MTTYLRTTRSFTAVSTHASTGRLSIGAIGLLTLILSNQDTFVIYKGTLQRRSKVGKKLFAKYWKELELNGFVYEIMSNNGRIKYEYIIVNDPTNETNIEAIDQILENREPFLIDGEMDTDNDLLNIVDGEEGANIYLRNEDLNNEDLNNEDLINESLAMSENLSNIDELTEYWYQNINGIELKEDEIQITEDQLFISTFEKIISMLKNNNPSIEDIQQKYPLIAIFQLYRYIIQECEVERTPYTSYFLANEIVSVMKE